MLRRQVHAQTASGTDWRFGLRYGYDGQGRIATLDRLAGPAAEAYRYDLRGNILEASRFADGVDGLDDDEIWRHALGPYQESQGRDRAGTQEYETLRRHPRTGRVMEASTWEAAADPTDPPRRVDQTSYRYDGQGRLVALSEASAERVWLGGYEVSDALVWDGVWGLGEDPSRVSGQAMTLRFAGWRGDGLGAGSSREVVTVSPALSVVKTGAKGWRSVWTVRGYDGQGLAQVDDDGVPISASLLGAYGSPVRGFGPVQAGRPSSDRMLDLRRQQGFHGSEHTRIGGLAHMGTRHSRLADGLWLQPEPLLGLGIPRGGELVPESWFGVYSNGDSVNLWDPTGHEPTRIGAGKVVTVRENLKAIKVETWKDVTHLVGTNPLNISSPGMPTEPEGASWGLKFRYAYTESAGWMDMQHVLVSAQVTNEAGSFLSWALGYGVEVHQAIGVLRGKDTSSAFSYEDLPSNTVGRELGRRMDGRPASDVGVVLLGLLEELGLRDPEEAPNWEDVPEGGDGRQLSERVSGAIGSD